MFEFNMHDADESDDDGDEAILEKYEKNIKRYLSMLIAIGTFTKESSASDALILSY